MATVATCLLCRNSFSDPIQTDFINNSKTGFCKACAANLDKEIVPQQPNVGVAPIADPLKAHQDDAPGETGYETPSPLTGSEMQIPVKSAAGEPPLAVTPQVGNEAYNQGQAPTTSPATYPFSGSPTKTP